MPSLKRHFQIRPVLLPLAVAATCAFLGGVWLNQSGATLFGDLGRTAWSDALAEDGNGEAWPFGVAQEPDADGRNGIRKLGFAAVMNDGGSPALPTRAALNDEAEAVAIPAVAGRKALLAADPHLQPDDVAVGDRVTLVTADGLSHTYRVTARQVVDPDAPISEAAVPGPAKDGKPAAAKDAKAEACESLNSLVAGALQLVIEAVKTDPKHHAAPEQKL